MAGEQQDIALYYASEGSMGTQALSWQKEEQVVTEDMLLSPP